MKSPPDGDRAESAGRAPAGRRRRTRHKKSSRLVLPGLLLVVLTTGIVFAIHRTHKWPRHLVEPRPFDQADAYWLCKVMLERVSSDPGKTVIPPVESTEIGGNFHFIWGDKTHFLHMPNSLGLKSEASGSCTVDATRHSVTSLTVDGKVLR